MFSSIKWILQATSSSTLKTKLSLLREALPRVGKASDVVKCMLCPNMCLHVCPVFDVERRLTVSPSIKSRLAYFSSSGEDVGDTLWRCLPCNACKETCPMNISVNELLIDERSKICDLDGEPRNVKLAFVSHESMIKDLEKKFKEQFSEFEKRDGKLLYFPGCRTFEASEIIKSTLKILNFLEIDFAFKGVLCCGSYLKELGYLKQFREHAQNLRDILGSYEGVVSNCPHCVKVFLEDYGIRATHISQLIAGNIDKFKEGIEANKDKSESDKFDLATYHDPCILSRDLGMVEEPRKILSAFGIKIKEAGYSRKNTYCCGSGGIYPYIDASMASKLAEERKSQLLEASQTILTFCPRCKRALDAKDVTEILAKLI